MMGGNTNEGSMYMVQFLLNEELFQEVAEDFDTQAPILMLGVDEDEITEEDSATCNLMKNEYLDGLHTNFTKDNWKRISKLISDVLFLVPIDFQTRLMRNSMTENIFYYHYSHKGGLTLPMLYPDYADILDHDFGVCHADDLWVLFRQGILGPKNEMIKVGQDPAMIKKMVEMWTKFSTDGQPHPDWPSLTNDKHQWAVLNSKPIKMTWDEDFGQKVEFVQAMMDLVTSYRHMDFQDHPAVKKMMEQPSQLEDSIDLEPVGEHHDEL
jgi:carboxylesterase type B